MANNTNNQQNSWWYDLISLGGNIFVESEKAKEQAEIERIQAQNTQNQGALALAETLRTNKIINFGIYAGIAMIFIFVFGWFMRKV